jgi:hypothetical protein
VPNVKPVEPKCAPTTVVAEEVPPRSVFGVKLPPDDGELDTITCAGCPVEVVACCKYPIVVAVALDWA